MMGTVSDPTPTPILIEVDGRPMAWHVGDRLFPYVAGGSEPPAGDPPAGDPPAGDPPAGDPPADEPKVSMSQAELDKLITREKDKARRQAADEAAQAAERAKLDDVARLEAEKADAEKAAADALAKANGILVKAEAKGAALAAQVKPDRVDAFLRTVDLADVEVDADGTVDAKALATIIDDGLKALPEFKAAPPAPGSGGGDFAGGTPPTRATDLASAVDKRLAKAG